MVHHKFWSASIPVRKRRPEKRKARSPRTSVTFPTELYESLEAIAKNKKVSLAWVVREAAEKYVNDQLPLSGISESR